MKLTQARIKAAKPHPNQTGHRRHAKYGDGRGLWLMVDPNGNKSWAFLYTINKRSRHMGLGSIEELDLDAARDRALELRRLVKRGIDPLAQLQAERAANQGRLPPSERPVPVFEEVAEQVRDIRIKGLTNEKVKAGWLSSISTYVYPHVKGVPIDRVTFGDLEKALEGLRHDHPDTARKLRFKILNILDYAAAHDWLDEARLAKISRELKKIKIQREKERHPHLDFKELPDFMMKLRQRPGFSARALEFLILTAARSQEVRGAEWSEIDLKAGVWSIPKERMKAREPHTVPLSKQAIAILKSLHKEEDSDLVFPSATKPGTPMSDMTLLQALRRMGRNDISVHGFRATFRTWVAEETNYPGEVAEAALAHKIPNEVERAYKRTEFFDKRRKLMQTWASFCDGPATGEKVVPIRKAR
jgi:integrase